MLALATTANGQLMSYAAWPVEGRNSAHTANGLIAAPNNTVNVVKYKTGGMIYSSPVVGGDGTVYIGSADHNLYALHPDGSLKWKYPAGGEILSSPALCADGTVYVGSLNNMLHAIKPDGTTKFMQRAMQFYLHQSLIRTALSTT